MLKPRPAGGGLCKTFGNTPTNGTPSETPNAPSPRQPRPAVAQVGGVLPKGGNASTRSEKADGGRVPGVHDSSRLLPRRGDGTTLYLREASRGRYAWGGCAHLDGLNQTRGLGVLGEATCLRRARRQNPDAIRRGGRLHPGGTAIGVG